MKNLIQVAGVIDNLEAEMLMNLGVHYLGFPLRLTVNKEDLTEDEAVEVIKVIKSPFKSVLITYLDDAVEIISFCRKLNVQAVQLHGKISLTQLQKTKELFPELEIIKSLVIRGDNESELESIVNTMSHWIDAYITDTFDPETGAEGATGKTHDWSISRKLIEMSPKPVILAGGINPTNVKQAILETRPAGVDVHTGVEGADGRKSYDLVKRFVEEANEAFAML